MTIPGKLYKIVNKNLYLSTIEDYAANEGYYPKENDIIIFLYNKDYNEHYKAYYCVNKTNKIVHFISNNNLIEKDIEVLC